MGKMFCPLLLRYLVSVNMAVYLRAYRCTGWIFPLDLAMSQARSLEEPSPLQGIGLVQIPLFLDQAHNHLRYNRGNVREQPMPLS